MTDYRQWVALNIREGKSANEIHNAIDWLERNDSQLNGLIDLNEPHPCVQFSDIIDKLICGIKENDRHREVIIKWLAEDKKVPFGKVLKTKALRKLWKYSNKISEIQLSQLVTLRDRMIKLEYPPTELKWLTRLIEKRG